VNSVRADIGSNTHREKEGVHRDSRPRTGKEDPVYREM
jgi:hypothetical protein